MELGLKVGDIIQVAMIATRIANESGGYTLTYTTSETNSSTVQTALKTALQTATSSENNWVVQAPTALNDGVTINARYYTKSHGTISVYITYRYNPSATDAYLSAVPQELKDRLKE